MKSKTPEEWHETEPDWDQEAHERDLAAAKKRVRDRQNRKHRPHRV